MVEYEYAELFTKDAVDKQIKIEYDGGTITNTELYFENVELTESICSESELRFGCCEASVLKFKVSNIFQPLIGKWLTVMETVGGNTDIPFQLGKYKVYSDKPTSDRKHREIVAYDAMYDIINADVADWYNTILPNADSTVTMKEFRTNFISHFGLEQEEIDLVNDDMTVEKTIEPSEISGRDVITAICETNGCFGHIGRNGKFRYIYLPQYIEGLYPSNTLYPANDLYPRQSNTTAVGKGQYIEVKYEDYKTESIKKLQIRKEENDIGVIVGTDGNTYIIEDNFLLYGKGSDELNVIAENILSKITDIVYRPFDATVKGNPCFEVGDAVQMVTKYDIVESYILNRTLKGIQALRDDYSADGVEEYSEKVNSVNKSIRELKGKTNILERNVEETKSEIESLETTLKKDYSTTTEMNSAIQQTAEGINLSVDKKITETKSYADDAASTAEENANKSTDDKLKSYSTTTEMNSAIQQTAEEINLSASKTYETKNNADSKYEELSAEIEVNAKKIESKVTSGEVQSIITQSADSIRLKAGKIAWDSTCSKMTENGELSCSAINITGGNINMQSTDDSIAYITVGNNDGIRTVICGGGAVRGYNHNGVTTIMISPLLGNIACGSLDARSSRGIGLVSADAINATSLAVSGTKSRVAETDNYGERLLYCYETPTPLFGDIGEGKIDDTGKCIIFVDDIFTETIDTEHQYQVFLQPYGDGKCYVTERNPIYFVVEGTANLAFGWEVKAVQRGYDFTRLESYQQQQETEPDTLNETLDYVKSLLYDIEQEEI